MMQEWCWLAADKVQEFENKARELGGVRVVEGGPLVRHLVGPKGIVCIGWRFSDKENYDNFSSFSSNTDHGLSDEEVN